MRGLKWQFYLGIAILVLLAASYFYRIDLESGQNYLTYTRLLSLLIFYSPMMLGLYIIVAFILIYFGLGYRIKLVD